MNTNIGIHYSPEELECIKAFQDGSMRQKIVKLLLCNVGSTSFSELQKYMKLKSHTALHTHLTKIRLKTTIDVKKHGDELIIRFKPERRLVKKPKSKASNDIPKAIKAEKLILNLIPEEYIDQLNHMSSPDQDDVFDMLKKAYFYQKSAIALIEADACVRETLKHTII